MINNLSHLTFETGDLVISPRETVGDDIIHQLQLDLANNRPLCGTEWRAKLRKLAPGAWSVSLSYADIPVVDCIVCVDEAARRPAEMAAERLSKVNVSGLKAPWLGVALMHSSMLAFAIEQPTLYLDVLSQVGDLERCIAWALIEANNLDAERMDNDKVPPSADRGGVLREPKLRSFDGAGASRASSSGGETHEFPGPKQGVSPDGLVILPDDGAVLDIGPSGLHLTVQMAGIAKSETAALRRGRLEVAVLSSGATGFLITRFHSVDVFKKAPIVLEAPFHIGLLRPALRFLQPRGDGLVHSLVIQIQDEHGIQAGVRLVSLTTEICEAIERLVDRQAREAAQPGWTRRSYDREVEVFTRRFPDVGRAADRLFARAHASHTVH